MGGDVEALIRRIHPFERGAPACLHPVRAVKYSDQPGVRLRISALTRAPATDSLAALRYSNGDIQCPTGSRPVPEAAGTDRRVWGAGCLAFALIWLELGSFRAGADEISAAPNPASPGTAPAFPVSVDLRPAFEKWGLARRIQGERGTCSVFTVAGALEFAAASRQRHGERFSVEFLNWGANRIAGEDKDGGFFSDLWRAFAVYGICSEKTMPCRADFDPALAPTLEVLA